MSTSVLNNAPSTATTDSSAAPAVPGPSTSSTASSSSHQVLVESNNSRSASTSNNNDTSTTSTPTTSASVAGSSNTPTGAPTSVVVTPGSSSSQQQQPNPVAAVASTSSQGSPVLASGSSLANTPSSSSSSTSTSQIQYVSENYIQPIVLRQTAAARSHWFQQMAAVAAVGTSASSSGSHSTTSSPSSSVHIQQQLSSNESHANPTSQQSSNDLMKRTYELIRESFVDSESNKQNYSTASCSSASDPHHSSKRSKLSRDMMAQGQAPGAAGQLSSAGGKYSLEDALTVRQKLEQRLNGILCCAVCLDLPKSSIYQCTNGHLMCAGCFSHVLADARLRDESPTCPSCRVGISKETCSRNLAVEKAVCELPGECRFCQRELPRSMLDKHMAEVCEERIVSCRFSNIGCPWHGPFHEADYHANTCSHPNKTAREVLGYLEEQELKQIEQRKIHETMFGLLSCEKISFHDVQFRPYRTDEYIHKLYYETSRFTAFNLQWVIKARVNDDQRDPTQSCERQLSFQLCLKSKIPNAMTIHYMLLTGPYGESKVLPMIYKFDFSESQTESTYNLINLATATESNRLLSARMMNFRLIMFQATNNNSK